MHSVKQVLEFLSDIGYVAKAHAYVELYDKHGHDYTRNRVVISILLTDGTFRVIMYGGFVRIKDVKDDLSNCWVEDHQVNDGIKFAQQLPAVRHTQTKTLPFTGITSINRTSYDWV